jgi:serine/threonine protein kinase
MGTPFYMAPEVLAESYTEKCDIWSIGVICYMLLSGKVPFTGRSNAELYHNTKDGVKFNPDDWKDISNDAINFVKKLLIVEPSKRPTAA